MCWRWKSLTALLGFMKLREPLLQSARTCMFNDSRCAANACSGSCHPCNNVVFVNRGQHLFSLSLSETRVQASWNPAKECADHAADVGAHGYTSSHNLESAWPPRSQNVNFLVGGAASQGDIPEGLE